MRAPVIGRHERVLGGTEEHPRRRDYLAPALEAAVIAHAAGDFQQRHRVQVEYRLGLGMIAGLHAVAGQTEDVGGAHRGAAEDLALDGDAVTVAAGDLHDGGVADPGQQRTDADAGHVAVGPRTVGGIDGIDVAVEDRRALEHLARIGGVRRIDFRGDGEFAGTQHPLQPAGRDVAGQDRQGIAGNRLVVELHCTRSSFRCIC
ncbi:hypothetical protein D9M68_800160 [compost metagenome]